MRILPVRFRKETWADLESLSRLLRDSGATDVVVRRYVQRITDRCFRIGDIPEGYPARDDLGQGLRAAPFERSALIVYRIEPNAVEIVNVFYRRRNYTG